MSREIEPFSFQAKLDKSSTARATNFGTFRETGKPGSIISSPSSKEKLSPVPRALLAFVLAAASMGLAPGPAKAQQNGESTTSADPTNPGEGDPNEESQDFAQGVPGRPPGSPTPIASPTIEVTRQTIPESNRLLTEMMKIDLNDPETWRVQTPENYSGEPFGIRIIESPSPRENLEMGANLYSIGDSRNLSPDAQHVGIFFQVAEGFPKGVKFGLYGFNPQANDGKGRFEWVRPNNLNNAPTFEPYKDGEGGFRWYSYPHYPQDTHYNLVLFDIGNKVIYYEIVRVGEGPVMQVNRQLNIATLERKGPELRNP